MGLQSLLNKFEDDDALIWPEKQDFRYVFDDLMNQSRVMCEFHVFIEDYLISGMALAWERSIKALNDGPFDDAGKKRMQCIGKSRTKEVLCDSDDMLEELQIDLGIGFFKEKETDMDCFYREHMFKLTCFAKACAHRSKLLRLGTFLDFHISSIAYFIPRTSMVPLIPYYPASLGLLGLPPHSLVSNKSRKNSDSMKKVVKPLMDMLLGYERKKQMHFIGNNLASRSNQLFWNAVDMLVLPPNEPEKPGFLSSETKKIIWSVNFERKDIFKLPYFRNADYHHRRLLRIETPPLQASVKRQLKRNIPASMNQMNTKENTLHNNKPCDVKTVHAMEALGCNGNNIKMYSQLQDNSIACNLNKHKETMPRGPLIQLDSTFINQHKRKDIAPHISSFVIPAIVFLWIILDICSQSPTMQLQPVHKENGRVFIWFPLLELLGFMVFVWAVAITILVGAQFSDMQSAMLIFWAILMLVKSANSRSAVHVPILGEFFMGWYARG